MKIFITGGTGYIGRNLIRHLCSFGYECTVYVRKDSDISVIKDIKCSLFYENDICSLIKHFEENKYNGIIHLASLYINSHTSENIYDLILSNILLGTFVLEAAVKAGIKWFINTGTFMQHYENKGYSPVNLYAATKQAFEDIAQYYMETSNICFKTLKLNDTYGPNDPRPKIFNLLKKTAETNSVLEMSPGGQIMDIVYIDDVINAFSILIEKLINEPADLIYDCYAISAKERYTLKELVKIYEKNIKKSLNIKWGVRPYREREVMTPWQNFNLLPDWSPKTSLVEGIKSLYE